MASVFGKSRTYFEIWKNITDFLEGQDKKHHLQHIRKCSALNGAPREQEMWVLLHYLLYFSDILSKPHAQKKWHTFSGFGPTSLS